MKKVKSYNVIRAIAIMMIVVYHFLSSLMEHDIHVSTIFPSILMHGSMDVGALGVGMFFMLSGALLWKNYKDSFSLKEFYKKRVLRIFVPLWISYLFALIVIYIVNPSAVSVSPVGIVLSLLGLDYTASFWNMFGITTAWLVGQWFTAVIIFVYILFPIIRYLFQKHRIIGSLVIFVLFALNLKFQILSYADGWFSFTNGIMYFWIGMLYEQYRKKIPRVVGLACLICGIILILINPSQLLGIAYIPCFLLSILLFVALSFCNCSSPQIDYISRYSYEIYLIHDFIFVTFIPIFLNSSSNQFKIALFMILCNGIIFLLSRKINEASNYVISFFGKNICQK